MFLHAKPRTLGWCTVCTGYCEAGVQHVEIARKGIQLVLKVIYNVTIAWLPVLKEYFLGFPCVRKDGILGSLFYIVEELEFQRVYIKKPHRPLESAKR